MTTIDQDNPDECQVCGCDCSEMGGCICEDEECSCGCGEDSETNEED